MTSRKHLGFAIMTMLTVVGLGGLALAWPSYRQAASVKAEADALIRKGETYDVHIEDIAELTELLEEATHRVAVELKEVPETPDIAGLMRVLSLPVDGDNVRDQTFTAGHPKEAAAGAELSAMVVPLTVEMEARFDSIFALIRVAESMPRLLRVASVNIVCERQDATDVRFGRATVVLEAVYDTPAMEGDG